jgi:predicted ATP-grasp superfamily ATP-dependent carboligase
MFGLKILAIIGLLCVGLGIAFSIVNTINRIDELEINVEHLKSDVKELKNKSND